MRTLTHRLVSAATIVLLLFASTSCDQDIEEVLFGPPCAESYEKASEIWTDVLHGRRDKVALDSALTLIDYVIACDTTDAESVVMKGQILQMIGKDRQLLEHVERFENIYDQAEPTVGANVIKAICYYFLKDSTNFDTTTNRVLNSAQRAYEDNKNVDNLVIYAFVLRLFDSYESAIELVDQNLDMLQDPISGSKDTITWEDVLRDDLGDKPTLTIADYDSIAAAKLWRLR